MSEAKPEETSQQKGEGSNLGYRRNTRVRSRPKYLNDYCAIALSVEGFLDEVPQTFTEIETREDKHHWKKVVQDEMDSLLRNRT